MPTEMQRITQHDKQRLHERAAKHGRDGVEEITALLDLAETVEAKTGEDPALLAYRAKFVRVPKP